MHPIDPKGYGTRNIPTVFYGEIPPSGDASGYAQNMAGDATGLNWQAGQAGIGQYTLRQEQAMMQQQAGTSGGRSHLWAAGMVTGAIVLLFLLGMAFPGVVQF